MTFFKLVSVLPNHIAFTVLDTPITPKETLGNLLKTYPLKVSVIPVLKKGDLYETGGKCPFETTRQSVVNHIYTMLEDTHALFQKNQINYLIDGGTQLGATRHGGLIPWDDDADIVILEDDEYRFLELIPAFNEKGYEIFAIISEKEVSGQGLGYVFGGYQLCPRQGENRPSCNLLYPGMDIYTIRPDAAGRYQYGPTQIRDLFPGMEFEASEWQNRSLVPFGHLKLMGLSGVDATHRLNKLYGENWNHTAETNTIDHRTVLLLDKHVKSLGDARRDPALKQLIPDRINPEP